MKLKICDYTPYRSNHPRCSIKKGDLQNFTKFTGKNLCQSLFQAEACNFINKRLWHRCFHVNFVKFSRIAYLRSSQPEVFLGIGVLKICSKFTGDHPCRSAISIKLLCNFIKIAVRHGCSPVNLPHIFRRPFSKNTSGIQDSFHFIRLLRTFELLV